VIDIDKLIEKSMVTDAATTLEPGPEYATRGIKHIWIEYGIAMSYAANIGL
jgi:hypothetical protein